MGLTRRRWLAAGGAMAAVVVVLLLALADDGGDRPEMGARDSGAPVAAIRSRPTPVQDPMLSGVEADVIRLVNERRQAGAVCGVERFTPAGPLRPEERLARAARAHALDMAARRYFAHESPQGENVDARVSRQGYRYGLVGENIAAGQETAAGAVEGWMKSEGHCRNIMNPGFGEVGVGFAPGSGGRYDTYWVLDFGTPMPGWSGGDAP